MLVLTMITLSMKVCCSSVSDIAPNHDCPWTAISNLTDQNLITVGYPMLMVVCDHLLIHNKFAF